MVNSFFSSFGLSFSTSVFIMVIGIVYYLKNKKTNQNIINKAFVYLIILTIILGATELIVTISLSRTLTPTITNSIICITSTFLGFLWNEVFLMYIYILIKNTMNQPKKISVFSWILIALLNIGVICLLIFTPIEYTTGINNEPYVITGGMMYFTLAISIITNLIGLTIFAIYREKIKNIYLTPMILIMIANIVVTLLKIYTNTFMNDRIAFYAIIVVLLYLTIESQDNKLIDEYNKSKEEAIKANKAKTEFLINMS